MSRGKIIAAVVAVVVIGAIAAGVAVSARNAVPEVSTAKATKETLGVVVTASGKVGATTKADVYPGSAGTLKSVDVTDGARVKAGDVIAAMDTGPLEVSAQQALAGIAAADAQYAAAGMAVPTSADYASANAAITAANSVYRQADDAYDAYKYAYDQTSDALIKASMEATLTQLRIIDEQTYAALKAAQAGKAALDKASNVTAAR